MRQTTAIQLRKNHHSTNMNPRFRFAFDVLWFPYALTTVLVAVLFIIYAMFPDPILRMVATLAVFLASASVPIWRSVHLSAQWGQTASKFLTSADFKDFQLGLYFFYQRRKNLPSRYAEVELTILEGFKRHKQLLSPSELIMTAELGICFMGHNGKSPSPLLDIVLGTLKERTLSAWHEARLNSMVLRHLSPK